MKKILIILFIILPTFVLQAQRKPKGYMLAHKAKLYYDRRDYENALKMFTKLLSKNPHCDSAYYYRAIIQYTKKNYQAALVDAGQAIKYNTNNAKAYYVRGQILSHLKNYNEAIKDFTRAALLVPNNANVYYALGLAQNNVGDFENAVNSLTSSIKYNKGNNILPYKQRGYANYMLKNSKKAISDLNRMYEIAMEKFPERIEKDEWIFRIRAWAKVDAGMYQEAILDFDKAMSIYALNMSTFKGRGLAKIHIGDYDNAIDDLTRSIELAPKDAPSFELRGVAFYKKGIYDEAIDDFNKAIALDNKDAVAYYYRGLSHEMMGNNENAILDFAQTNKINPYFDGLEQVKGATSFAVVGVEIQDPNNNKNIEKNESVTLVVKVKNTGQNDAQNVKIKISDNNNNPGLLYNKVEYWGNILKGETKELFIHVDATEDLSGTNANFIFLIKDNSDSKSSPYSFCKNIVFVSLVSRIILSCKQRHSP